jgi:hypothetical protein
MRNSYIFLVIIVGIVATILFFYPKADCGRDIGFGAFDKYRCSCLGFIGRTPVSGMNVDFDSTIDYSCFGIKIGKTRLINRNLEFFCSDKFLCVYPSDIILKKGNEEIVTIFVRNYNNVTISYKLQVSGGAAYDEYNNKIDNGLEFSYDNNILVLNNEDKKQINLVIKSDTETRAGAYVFEIVLVNMSNETVRHEQLYVRVK